MKNKKLITAVAVVITAVILLLGGFFIYSRTKKSDEKQLLSIAQSKTVNPYAMPVNLIAHRGFSGLAPENTLAAVKVAGDADYFGCEFDIRLTKDNKWVVSHDNDVERMTDGEGLISDMTAEEVKKLNIDAGSNVTLYSNEKIPTLNEMLDACKEYGVNPVIELKIEDGQAPDYEGLARTIREKGFGDCIVISFNSDALAELKQQMPTAEYWLLASDVTDNVITTCVENGFSGLDFNANKKKNLKYINKAAESGLVLSAWTVDTIELLDELYTKGVFYITTNVIYPS